VVAQIDEVVTKPKFEFGSNLNDPCPKSRTALLKSRPSEGVEKAVLSLDEILPLRAEQSRTPFDDVASTLMDLNRGQS
jgi:hypothetical protein